MNEKEARELPYVDQFRSPTQHGLYREAKGYLECYEKAQKLEEVLIKMDKSIAEIHGRMSIRHEDIVELLEALSEWKKDK